MLYRPDFFSSADSKLELFEKIQKRISTFVGGRVKGSNNFDVAQVHKLGYGPKLDAGYSKVLCAHLRSAIGQFLEFDFVIGIIDSNRICKAGLLFSGAINLEAVNSPLSCSAFKTFSSTVLSEAFYL